MSDEGEDNSDVPGVEESDEEPELSAATRFPSFECAAHALQSSLQAGLSVRGMQTLLKQGRFNALLRATKSLAHVTPNVHYFSPGTCIATTWTVFLTLLLLWPQPHF